MVIPVYNRSNEVKSAIESVTTQSYQDLEIIVVDDASTDELQASIEFFADPRIRLVQHAQNRGAAASRNTGLEAARGDWVAFLDSDDAWDVNKLDKQLASLAAKPAASAGVTGYRIRHFAENQIREYSPRAADAMPAAFLWGCRLCPGTTLMVDRRCFQEIGPFDTRLRRFEDWDWLIRYTRAHPLAVEPSVLASINRGDHPDYAAVVKCVAIMRAKYLGEYYAISRTIGRKFESTLLIETAAAAYYGGRGREALGHVLHALLCYPFRDGAFFAMMWRRLSSMARLDFARSDVR